MNQKLIGVVLLSATFVSACAFAGTQNLRACKDVASLFEKDKKSVSLYEQYFCSYATEVQERIHDKTPALNLLGDSFKILIFLTALSERETGAYILEAEEARTDKQVGGSSANSGSTSLTTKASVPAVLGFAVENGALTKDASGTTITFRGNPVGIYKALGKTGFVRSYEEIQDDPDMRLANRFSFAVSFDTSRGATPGTFTGDKQQLSAYSFRFDVLNHRDPRSAIYQREWEGFLVEKSIPFNNSLESADNILLDTKTDPHRWKDPALQHWFEETGKALAAANAENGEEVLKARIQMLPIKQLLPDTLAEIHRFALLFGVYLEDRSALLKRVAQGPIFTFEYTNNRQVDSSDFSNFSLIAETGLFAGRADLTANASFSIFNNSPSDPGANRLKDAQISGQLDVPLGQVQKIGSFVFSVSGKFQHINENTLITAKTADLKGNIGVGQLKFTVPVKGSGVKIPLSVTFANRTELIKEKNIRGNIGLTFDMDSIFSKFNP